MNRPPGLHQLPARALVQVLVEQPHRTPQPGTEAADRVVQIFPNTESVIRLVGALLVEINDEMISSERRYIAAGSLEPLLDRNNNPLTSLPAAPRT
jgi:hypothetical protein